MSSRTTLSLQDYANSRQDHFAVVTTVHPIHPHFSIGMAAKQAGKPYDPTETSEWKDGWCAANITECRVAFRQHISKG